MSILNIPTAGTLQGTGFNFINDITTANQSILASIDLNSPNPPTTNIEMIHPSFECIKDMDIEAYHQILPKSRSMILKLHITASL